MGIAHDGFKYISPIKMTEWPSKRGPITKIMLPDGVKVDTAPLALGLWYDFHEVRGRLENVG